MHNSTLVPEPDIHDCTVHENIASKNKIILSLFEPVQIVEGIFILLAPLYSERKNATVRNHTSHSVPDYHYIHRATTLFSRDSGKNITLNAFMIKNESDAAAAAAASIIQLNECNGFPPILG